MLAQQMDAAGHRVVAGRASEREVLSQAVAECDRILDALERGGRALEREVPAAEGAVREELHLVRRQWVEVKPALLALASRSGDDPETHAAFARVEPLVASLPRAAHRVVLAMRSTVACSGGGCSTPWPPSRCSISWCSSWGSG